VAEGARRHVERTASVACGEAAAKCGRPGPGGAGCRSPLRQVFWAGCDQDCGFVARV